MKVHLGLKNLAQISPEKDGKTEKKRTAPKSPDKYGCCMDGTFHPILRSTTAVAGAIRESIVTVQFTKAIWRGWMDEGDRVREGSN